MCGAKRDKTKFANPGVILKSYVKSARGRDQEIIRKKRSGRSWQIRFGELYNLSREQVGLGVQGKNGWCARENKNENMRGSESRYETAV